LEPTPTVWSLVVRGVSSADELSNRDKVCWNTGQPFPEDGGRGWAGRPATGENTAPGGGGRACGEDGGCEAGGQDRSVEITQLVAQRRLTPVDRTLKMRDVAAVHAHVVARRVTGTVLLVP
jgi:hypothetical protein